MKIAPNFSIEDNYPNNIIAGIDEAGRGPLAGPVVAAAVIINRDINLNNEINDSKKISKKKRNILFEYITKNHFYGIGISSVKEIDEYNILEATKIAMIRAVNNLSKSPMVVLVDGNMTPNFKMISYPIIKGDSKSISIAAASIIAKVTRDRIMDELAIIHNQYGWDTNSGYGTKKHLASIEQYGICEHHRKSFAPIKQKVQQLDLL